MKMCKAPGNWSNRCFQQGRSGAKSFSVARFLWGPLLDWASLAELQQIRYSRPQLELRGGGGGSCVQVAVGNWS